MPRCVCLALLLPGRSGEWSLAAAVHGHALPAPQLDTLLTGVQPLQP
jgi:hypothetical protein